MRVALVLVLAATALVPACSYDDPALDGRFKCDDTHPCPTGETCVAGACSGGSGSSDGEGIECGSATCAPGMQCCAGPIGQPVCQALGASCTAGGIGLCDGVEDCGPGEACCGTSDTACDVDSCPQRACQSGDDCLGQGTGNCCFTISYLPWGICC